MHQTALMKVIKLVGSQKELARRLHVDPIRINHWLNRDHKIPYEYCVAMEMLTNGRVSSQELAPYAQSLLQQAMKNATSLTLYDVMTCIRRMQEDLTDEIRHAHLTTTQQLLVNSFSMLESRMAAIESVIFAQRGDS